MAPLRIILNDLWFLKVCDPIGNTLYLELVVDLWCDILLHPNPIAHAHLEPQEPSCCQWGVHLDLKIKLPTQSLVGGGHAWAPFSCSTWWTPQKMSPKFIGFVHMNDKSKYVHYNRNKYIQPNKHHIKQYDKGLLETKVTTMHALHPA